MRLFVFAALLAFPSIAIAQQAPSPAPAPEHESKSVREPDTLRFCYFDGHEYSKGAVLKNGQKCDYANSNMLSASSAQRPLEWHPAMRVNGEAAPR